MTFVFKVFAAGVWSISWMIDSILNCGLHSLTSVDVRARFSRESLQVQNPRLHFNQQIPGSSPIRRDSVSELEQSA
jgi:hypothetical protein